MHTLRAVKARVLSRLPHRSLIHARIRTCFSRHPLPPGGLLHFDEDERKDRQVVLKQAAVCGPVFRAVGWRKLFIFIVGLSQGRRFLQEHGPSLRLVSPDPKQLFPKGFLRQMEGADHARYRGMLVQAIQSIRPGDDAALFTRIATQALEAHESDQRSRGAAPDALIATLNTITSGMLILRFFGAEPGTEPFERMMEGYHRLGPHGFVWHIGEKQRAAFVEIRDALLRDHANGKEPVAPWRPGCLLAEICRQTTLDETILGNLIHMVETGRHDTCSLLRWLTKYAADNPSLMERIAGEPSEPAGNQPTLAEAFVLETLRMNQSDRLLRTVQRDIVFDGFLIPKHSFVRICLWESHKSAEAFPQPFEFDPLRFLNTTFTSDQYSPFGLDHHRCPLANMTIEMGVNFLRVLARNYTLDPVGDGPAVRGAYHWEAPREFTVRITKRTP